MRMLLVAMMVAFGLQMHAQNVSLTGKVTDASDGFSMPGVTIAVKNSTMGTTTDFDGNYTLGVPAGATVVFSFVGYETQEFVVQKQQTLNVALKAAVTYLNEFVVIGYGQVRKGDATGSVTSVSVKDFNQGVITNPMDLISGKTAGVNITSNSGAPGSGSTIRIRGGSSMTASNDPLFVIDGVPVDNRGIAGTRNPLSSINPNDIETFTVLKDASATAIYGSRASNGVIIITTKKGSNKDGKAIKLEYSGAFSLFTIPKKREVLTGDEFRAMLTEKFGDKPNVLALLGNENTNWQDQIFRQAFGMDHNIAISGQVSKLPYRVSLGYADFDGVLKTDNMKRVSTGIILNPSLFDDHLKINLSAKGTFNMQRFENEGAIGSAIQMDPTQPVYDEGNIYGGYWTRLQLNGSPVTQSTKNPLALIEQREDKSEVNRFLGNAQFDYKFHFLPELKANLNLGMDRTATYGDIFVPGNASFNFDAQDGGGTIGVYEQKKSNEVLDFTLTYAKELSTIQSRFDVMGGYSWQHFYREGSSSSTNDTTSPFFVNKIVSPLSDYATESYLVSFFGRFNYYFKDRYILTFTLRNDGSSRFSKETRWGLFPSAALAWRIMDEAWMKQFDNLSELKLRVGYGVTGQEDIGGNDYPYMPVYVYGQNTASYQFGNEFYQTYRPGGYDANIKWEETSTINLAVDYGFFRDRIYGSLEFYTRETKDLINFIPIPAGTNLSNYLVTNVGNLTNTGVEFSINAKPVIKKDMQWEIGFNATFNNNEITKLTAIDDPAYLGVFTGGISGGVGSTIQIFSVGYPSYSFFVFEQVYDQDGKPIEGLYVDRNKDGKITDDDRYHYKKPAPDFILGFYSKFDYKDWTFSFNGRANFGNYVYDNFNSNNATYERLYRPEGPYLSNVGSDVNEAGFYDPQYTSDYYIKDGSFLKLDNVTVGYSFNDILGKKTNLALSATVNNVFTISKYDGIDPEIFSGIDNLMYPRTRAFVLGLNFSF